MEHPENSSEYAGLQVNSGVEQPSIINPYMKRNRFRRRELTTAEMVEGILKGDVTILSQAVTLIESVSQSRPSGEGAGGDQQVPAIQWQ